MDPNDEILLQENGWIVTCESPLEIESEDGYSTATNYAAEIILDYYKIIEESSNNIPDNPEDYLDDCFNV